MRVAVTGAGGFIGRALLEYATGRWEITAITTQTAPPHCSHIDACRLIAGEDVGVIEPFDALVHLAGNADHGVAGREPWRDLDATAAVAARILPRVPATRLVLLSSAAVYAGRRGVVSPRVYPRPAMPYALSKLYVEGLVEWLRGEGRWSSTIILRLYNAFGHGERPSRLIPRVAHAVRRAEPFVLTGHPQSLADPICVADLVRVLVAAVESPAVGTFDVCGGTPTPIVDFVAQIAASLGYAPPFMVQRPDPGQLGIHFWSDPTPLQEQLALPAWTERGRAIREYGEIEHWTR